MVVFSTVCIVIVFAAFEPPPVSVNNLDEQLAKLPWQTNTRFRQELQQNVVKSEGYIVNRAGSACGAEEVLRRKESSRVYC